MFASSPAGRRSSGSSSGGSANASANANASAAPTAEPAMTQAELLAHQLDLHQKIQQQMQLQMEMSLQLGARQNMAASMASRPSLTASLSRVEPDLGDNVFDMLDDLIMIPGGSVASDTRASLSKHMEADDDDDANGGGAGGAGTQGVGSGSISGSRDSLADILESLDMDLEDFGDENKLIDTSHLMNANYNDEERDSFDDDLDDLDLDLDLEIDDHGIDDDDDAGNNLDDSIDAVDPNEHAVEEDFVHMRRSSLDMLASVSGSVSVSQSTTGNMCTLIWEGGLLGLRLRMSQSRMMPAVSKITGKSSIVGIHLVEVGDLLLQIGDRITRDMEFIDAINYLKEAPKPCKLVFRRLTSDPMIVKPIQPQVSSSIALKLASKFEELTQADNEKNPAPPAVKLDEKYEIKWLDGPLGISLIASKDVPYPLVTRITGKNRSPQVQDVQPGHYLVQIGNYNTADGNFNTAIKFLQKVTKPVSLYFCPGNKKVSARPDAADDEYDHIWEKKQALSFTVKPDAHGRMVVADVGSAKSIKVKAKGVPNIAAFISSGDQIRWINDDPTEGLTFHEALLKLRTAKRPLVIRFKKGPLGAPVDAPTPVPAPSPKSVPLTASDLSMSQASPAKKPLSSTNVPPPPPPPPQTQPPPQQQKPVPPPAPRSFNPLKKIAALGAYAKENSMNSGNGKNISNDGKKPSPDGAQTKKHTLFGSNGESDNHTRKYHEAAAAAAAAAAAQANANNGRAPKLAPPSGNNTRSPTASGNEYQHHQKASSNDGRHNNNGEPHSRIMNLDTLSSQQHRKVGLQKSPSDPAVQSSNSSDPAANLRPLSRGSAKNIPAASPPSDENSRYPSPSSSASTASSSRSYDKDSDVYEVVWPEGTALGLTLRVHPTTRFPVVARVTGTSNLKNIEHVQPGDILFAANNMNIVPQPKFKQTLENLSRLPKPAVLRFRRAQSSGAGNGTSSNTPRAEDTDHALPRGPPLKPSEYELIWRENANLGLVFSSDNDVPKVTKVDLESGGPMLQKVGVGDTLSWIGPMDIHGSSFHQSMATLRAIKRPVVLRFHKRQHR